MGALRHGRTKGSTSATQRTQASKNEPEASDSSHFVGTKRPESPRRRIQRVVSACLGKGAWRVCRAKGPESPRRHRQRVVSACLSKGAWRVCRAIEKNSPGRTSHLAHVPCVSTIRSTTQKSDQNRLIMRRWHDASEQKRTTGQHDDQGPHANETRTIATRAPQAGACRR